MNFNPRTPCGVRRAIVFLFTPILSISIHAPRVGCDHAWHTLSRIERDFNPRTPCGVRPGGDELASMHTDFNPRTPCGVRLVSYTHKGQTRRFQSTHPVWGATCEVCGCTITGVKFQSTHPVWGATRRPKQFGHRYCISIHAPRVGCDARAKNLGPVRQISIHAPRVGCDHSRAC